jgi:hypothetical protein
MLKLAHGCDIETHRSSQKDERRTEEWKREEERKKEKG